MTETEIWAEVEKSSLAALQGAQTLDQLGMVIAGIGRHFGFRFYKVYRSPVPLTAVLTECLLLTDLPAAFLSDFDGIGFSTEMVSSLRAIDQAQFSQWVLQDFLNSGDADKDARLFQLSTSLGLERGVFVNIASVDGPARIMGFLGRPEPLPSWQAEQLTMVAIQVLDRIERLEKRHGLDRAGLSSLEIEALRLAAQGHEAHEIGRRLGLTARTALYITTSVCTKLGVASLEEAVSEALRFDVIA